MFLAKCLISAVAYLGTLTPTHTHTHKHTHTHTHTHTHRLVLRFKHDNPSDVIHMDVNYMGQKFGCSVDEGKQLLNVAKSLQLDIIGVR